MKNNYTKEQFEQIFKDKFNTKFINRFEYVSGYIHSDGKFICRCLVCGEIKERTADCIRKGHRDIRCDECYKIECDNKKKSNEQLRIEKRNKWIKQLDLLKQQRIINNKLKEEYKQNQLIGCICSECGNVFNANRLNKTYCSNKCMNKHNNRVKDLRKRNKLKNNGTVHWDITLSKLIKLNKNICHICGSKCNDKDFIIDNKGSFIAGNTYPSIDHIKPINKGGTHTWDNIKLAHRYCNSVKSDNDIFETQTGQIVMAI
jgi:hypothetical protein